VAVGFGFGAAGVDVCLAGGLVDSAVGPGVLSTIGAGLGFAAMIGLDGVGDPAGVGETGATEAGTCGEGPTLTGEEPGAVSIGVLAAGTSADGGAALGD